jgi:hypothetical protein
VRRKKSRQLHRGPFGFADFEAAIKLDGWIGPIKGRRHPCYRHPTRKGTVQLDKKWTAIKPGHDGFRGVLQQGGYTKSELLRLLNGYRLDA